MTPEELLSPRYKVIALLPGSKRQIGEVIHFQDLPGWPTKEYYEDYPHLFKKLEWWEDRKPEDMPGYVKDDAGVYKVQEWHTEIGPKCTVYIDTKIHKGYVNECTECPLYSDILPATEAEYNQYIKQKEGNHDQDH